MPPASDLSGYVALILAGGYGKRLRPYTDSVPKPLLELREGYTILDKQLNDLRAAGVRRAVLLTGYLGELVERRYGREWNGMEIEYSREPRPLGTWGALRSAIESLSLRGPAIVTNGDVVTDVDLRTVVPRGDHLVAILAVPMRSPYGILELSGSEVVGFREKPVLPHYINGGVYGVRDLGELLEYGRDLEPPASLEDDLFPRLARAGLLGARVESDPEVLWRSVDSVKDLEELRSIYAERVDRPWGYEVTVARTDEYLHRRMYLREGSRVPAHVHRSRVETLHVERGRIRVEVDGGDPVDLGVGGRVTIPRGSRHSIAALRSSVVDEVAAPGAEDEVPAE
ncbi:sugar phosphate nucleotidyltransferase [Conexivisphaera calida]|uniref:Nucleotidyl transferase possibly involved in threonylcarbamoyladenosine formation n=1 Tax=Conexivisphaera calida TaxID=1874277 RepID=A0A4P2VPD7_9ARCH|nr:sugar phosphate nucleotidyltransferase [Conexivisphaera calida]BBE42755.1 Nucleotidyl transferase possibly involved in threonylcarbamoyladenosine formation [Conexivisphaera calida]